MPDSTEAKESAKPIIRKTLKEWQEEWKSKGIITSTDATNTELISEEAAKGHIQRAIIKKRLGNAWESLQTSLFLMKQARAEKQLSQLDGSMRKDVEEIQISFKEVQQIDSRLLEIDKQLLSLKEREQTLVKGVG